MNVKESSACVSLGRLVHIQQSDSAPASASCQSVSQDPSPALLPWRRVRKPDVRKELFYGWRVTGFLKGGSLERDLWRQHVKTSPLRYVCKHMSALSACVLTRVSERAGALGGTVFVCVSLRAISDLRDF